MSASTYLGQTLSNLGDRAGQMLFQRGAEDRKRAREEEIYLRARTDQSADQERAIRLRAIQELVDKGYLTPAQTQDEIAIGAAFAAMAADESGSRGRRVKSEEAQGKLAAGQVAEMERVEAGFQDAIDKAQTNADEIARLEEETARLEAEEADRLQETQQRIRDAMAGNLDPAMLDQVQRIAERIAADRGEKTPLAAAKNYLSEAQQLYTSQIAMAEMAASKLSPRGTKVTAIQRRLGQLYQENAALAQRFPGLVVPDAFSIAPMDGSAPEFQGVPAAAPAPQATPPPAPAPTPDAPSTDGYGGIIGMVDPNSIASAGKKVLGAAGDYATYSATTPLRVIGGDKLANQVTSAVGNAAGWLGQRGASGGGYPASAMGPGAMVRMPSPPPVRSAPQSAESPFMSEQDAAAILGRQSADSPFLSEEEAAALMGRQAAVIPSMTPEEKIAEIQRRRLLGVGASPLRGPVY